MTVPLLLPAEVQLFHVGPPWGNQSPRGASHRTIRGPGVPPARLGEHAGPPRRAPERRFVNKIKYSFLGLGLVSVCVFLAESCPTGL